VEAHHADADPAEAEEVVARSVAGGAGETLWEVDGVPVS
jgi:hypothetical protein